MKKGQIAVFVLLTTSVILIIGIATAARITSDIKLTTQTADSTQAMNAAEAGMENALSDPSMTNCGLPANFFSDSARADCTVTTLGAGNSAPGIGGISYTLKRLGNSTSRTIWLVNHDNNEEPIIGGTKYRGELEIAWFAGIFMEFMVIFGVETPSQDYRIVRYLTDSGAITFNSADYSDRWVFIKLKPVDDLSNTIDITVTPRKLITNFPPQGKVIDSRGVVIQSGVTRRIMYEKLYPSLPEHFDYVFFSMSGVTK